MEKRKACTILALTASLIFTGMYFLVFGNLKPAKTQPNTTVTAPLTQSVNLDKATLHWIQLGIYREVSSYEGLVAECQRQGMDPLVIQLQDKVAVVVGCSENELITNSTLNKVVELELEYMVKSADFSTQETLNLISEQKYQELLEGYIYQ